MPDRGNFRPALLVRVLSRLLAWAEQRDQARIQRENPRWWARVQEAYRRSSSAG
jgi:hypothetical protein